MTKKDAIIAKKDEKLKGKDLDIAKKDNRIATLEGAIRDSYNSLKQSLIL